MSFQEDWLVGGLVAISYFPINLLGWNVIIPIDEVIFFRTGFFPTTNQLGYDNHSLIYFHWPWEKIWVFKKIGIWLNHSRYCKFGKFWKFAGLWQSIFRTVDLGRMWINGGLCFTQAHRHWFDPCEGIVCLVVNYPRIDRFCGLVHPSYFCGRLAPTKIPLKSPGWTNPRKRFVGWTSK